MPKLNEKFSAKVRDISSEGNGVVEHSSGKTFFVPGVWVGEVGEFRITGFKSRHGFAELVKLEESSPERIEAPCQHHGFSKGKCGGCPWQFIEYTGQLRVKQQRIENMLERIEENSSEKIKNIWASPEVFGYRNRAQFKTDGQKIGYVSGSSRELAPIEDCLILNDKNRNTLQQLLQGLPRQDFKAGLQKKSKKSRGKNRNKNRTRNEWNTLDIDDQTSADEVAINQRRPFRQGNSAQNENMRQWLREKLLALKKEQNKEKEKQENTSEKVIELFCGSGNFTEIISESGFENIIAAEASQESIDELQSKKLPGVTTQVKNLFIPEKVEEIFWQNPDTNILVLDPPRDGFKGIEGMFSGKKKQLKNLKDIFYISCNPATFVRDIKMLSQQGFNLQEVQPLDQFPHTPHVELLAHLNKR